MTRSKSLSMIATVVAMSFLESPAWADRVSGLLTRTYILVEDTDLVGDVTCDVTGGPCFSFGASGIQLRLNGFTITGKADPVTGCAGTRPQPEFGITTNGMSYVQVRGPGMVQRFRNTGVFVTGSTGARVEDLNSSTNCGSGIQIAATSFETIVERNRAVRNGAADAPCGGI
jgi:hypothetical protein